MAIALTVIKVVVKPIITISRATSSSTRAMAEKKSRRMILTNLEISDALGTFSLYNDLKMDLSTQKASSHPNIKIFDDLCLKIFTFDFQLNRIKLLFWMVASELNGDFYGLCFLTG